MIPTKDTKDAKRAARGLSCISCFSLTILLFVLALASCSSTPTDVRSVVPADALVYLETPDLGNALKAVTDNDAFRVAAKSQPDLSALNGIRMAVAVTGFETKDIPTPDGPNELSVQPRFVAVAETNAWNYQAIKFAENKLGEFVNDIYGGGVELERFPRYDGDYFVWTADDGRKAYGLVIGSLMFFGNDETAIEKCVAVRKGEAEPIAKNSRVPSGNDQLAAGYVSPDGVAQIANIAAIQLAVGAGEEEEVRGFIARVLPEVLRNSVREATWTARKTASGMEDQYAITLEAETAKALAESIKPGAAGNVPGAELVPANVMSVTRYDLADPQLAWRSIVLSAQQRAGGLNGEIIAAVSGTFFEPYGVDDPEAFLTAVEGKILSLRYDAEGEEVLVIATPKDLARVKSSLAKEFKLSSAGEKIGSGEVWRSQEGELAFAVVGDRVVLGHADTLIKFLTDVIKPSTLPEMINSAPTLPAFSITTDIDANATLVSVLSQPLDEKQPVIQTYRISTSFTNTGIQRSETSSFGLIGTIIEQFAKN